MTGICLICSGITKIEKSVSPDYELEKCLNCRRKFIINLKNDNKKQGRFKKYIPIYKLISNENNHKCINIEQNVKSVI